MREKESQSPKECDLCFYNRIREEYKQKGKHIEVKDSAIMLNWKAIVLDDEELYWFILLPKECECKKKDLV